MKNTVFRYSERQNVQFERQAAYKCTVLDQPKNQDRTQVNTSDIERGRLLTDNLSTAADQPYGIDREERLDHQMIRFRFWTHTEKNPQIDQHDQGTECPSQMIEDTQ